VIRLTAELSGQAGGSSPNHIQTHHSWHPRLAGSVAALRGIADDFMKLGIE
jgi:hypothetical protein